MRLRALGLGLVALLAAGCASSGADSAGEPLTVAAASDLRPALTVLAEDFEEATGEEVSLVFGSSGRLAQQLAEGAPFDVYASADAHFVDVVLDAGRGDPDTRTTYAHGRLVLWARTQSWGGWADLAALAADPEVATVAIANPDHAPYGRAAREALESEGVSEDLRSRLVYGESVVDAQRLAASGNADAAIIALSLALAAEEAGEGEWAPVDGDAHEPLTQDLLVVSEEPRRAERAAEFVDHLDSEDGRAVMRRYGFGLPARVPADAPGR